MIAGALFALEFLALYLALKLTTASSAAVLLYTAPFFVALGAVAFLPSERLSARQWLGLGLAFLGVAIGLYRTTPGATLAGDLMALAAGALWGATTVVVKATRLKLIDPVKTLLYQTVASALVSGACVLRWRAAAHPYFRAFGDLGRLPIDPGRRHQLSVLVLAIKNLSRRRGFGVHLRHANFWRLRGVRLLGEPLTANFVAALALVVAGLVIVNWPGEKVIFRVLARGGRPDPG